ncbi:Galactarate dehydratase (L-threo-forming) [Streptomyces sp. enrichment culture]|uniref:UxaA family hydrolase n=1 Tax=Streptomyces sp. enrichment culture TaxID=1795815 RepID=UPI003F5665B8
MTPTPRPFRDVAVLPTPNDNAAVATRRIEAGTAVALPSGPVVLPYTVPEGHRFAVDPVTEGTELLSWGLPFARAVRDVAAGSYLATDRMLEVLRERRVPGTFPAQSNIADRALEPYVLDESALRPGRALEPHPDPGTFLGHDRGPGRGVGTRNHLVVLGASSRTASFVQALAERFAGTAAGEGFDGVVGVSHTEGALAGNNVELVLRTLAGFLTHPNVGAVLAVDEPGSGITNDAVRRYLGEHGYPPLAVPHAHLRRTGSFTGDLDRGAEWIEGRLPALTAARRTEQPLSHLRIALQCGGSDAFSGLSANPLAGAVAAELIRHGGGAILAETDELIGAEHYVLDNVRDADTARRFLEALARFTERVGWHGHTAETNVSGGNAHRGLYNITLKSIGAARKRDPAARLDHVLEYAQRMTGPGFHFMDSPGNDLESVAGEVASGANLIFFTTGNGSITNFPFVPTVKLVSTTGRYRQMPAEMDVDAGAHLTGTPMAELTRTTFDLAVRVAGGERTAGERAGHSQVSIWRDWRQTRPLPVGAPARAAAVARAADRDLPGEPLPVPERGLAGSALRRTYTGLDAGATALPERIALIMPTSLCSGQVALRLAARCQEHPLRAERFTRVVALPHTEGCGVSGGPSEDTYARLVVGCLTHPSVRAALLLEHGCEKTHNDYFTDRLRAAGVDPDAFGWAGIQADGGIAGVTERVDAWFETALRDAGPLRERTARLGALTLALHAQGPVPGDAARALADCGAAVVADGGTVVLPEGSPLLGTEAFRAFLGAAPGPTLAHGQRVRRPGWHVMHTPTADWLETVTGLGATGTHLMVAHVTGVPPAAHRMVPLLRVTADPATAAASAPDCDVVLGPDRARWTERLLDGVAAVAGRALVPAATRTADVGFQVTRGLLGVSI